MSATSHVALAPTTLRAPVDLEVVIPAYNEENRLPRTVASTVDYLSQMPWSSAVVVVDNGSVDRTAATVAGHGSDRVPVHVVGCRLPGKGAAVLRGFATGTSRFTGFMDADLATPVETLGLAMPILENGASAVIASRYSADAHLVNPQPGYRRIGGTVFRVIAKSVLPGVSDSQCGFKFFSRDVLEPVTPLLGVSGFAFDVELLALVRRHGGSIVEIPVDWTDQPGSSFSAVRHGPRTIADMVRIQRALDRLPKAS
jgi:glycosyltransferase involved in cell wall biosynthesis